MAGVISGGMAEKVEPIRLNPSLVLKSGGPDGISAIGKRGEHILASSTAGVHEWSADGELLRTMPSPMGDPWTSCFSEVGSNLLLSQRGGSTLSGSFCAVGHYPVTDSALEDLGWSGAGGAAGLARRSRPSG